MLKKIMLGFVIAATFGPLAAQANDPTACLLYADCFFDSGSLTWVCPDPSIYALCVDP